MAFDVMTITTKGAELLAAATTTNKLIIAGCDATQTFISQASAVNVSARPQTPLSTTTDCRLEPATNEHVFVRAFFVASQSTGGDAKSLYIYGHSESAPSDDYVLIVLSSQDSFHLPEPGDISNTYGVLVDIIYSPGVGVISTATSSVYTTYGEFADLRDRAVTTHAQGQATVGDNQTIYGTKTFKSTIKGGDGFNPIIGQDDAYYHFNTSYGGVAGAAISYNGSMYQMPTSSLGFAHSNDPVHKSAIESSDFCELKVEPVEITSGITRSFGLLSKYTYNNSTSTLSSLCTHMDRRIFSNTEKESGRVSLFATESTGTKSAKVDVKINYDSSGNPYSVVEAESRLINLDCYAVYSTGNLRLASILDPEDIDSNPYAQIVAGTTNISSTRTGMIVLATQDEDNIVSSLVFSLVNASSTVTDVVYSLFPSDPNSDGHKIDLGTSANKFNNIYATTFHGALDGAATSATNDANGNSITGYVKSVVSNSFANTVLDVIQGNGSSQSINLAQLTTLILRGKLDLAHAVYDYIGATGLFIYNGTADSYPLEKLPGETVSGANLRPACLARDEGTGDVSMPATTSGTYVMSGTWALLSYLYRADSSHLPLVLAVKISQS